MSDNFSLLPDYDVLHNYLISSIQIYRCINLQLSANIAQYLHVFVKKMYIGIFFSKHSYYYFNMLSNSSLLADVDNRK